MTTDLIHRRETKKDTPFRRPAKRDQTAPSLDLAVPLCIDLDGTLVRSDLLHEALLELVRRNVFMLFAMVGWLLRGKAAFKAEVAARTTPDVEHLPYNRLVVDRIKTARHEGRAIILVTASPLPWARAVAQHLGFFDDVMASTDANLSGETKGRALAARYGEGGFDYAGNAKVDQAVWAHARRALVVNPDRSSMAWAKENDAEILCHEHRPFRRLRVWAKAVRVHQWLKNTLLFVPAILALNIMDVATAVHLVIAFFAFSLCASSVYLLNDTLDLRADRAHPTKCLRPIAAGRLGVRHAVVGSFMCLITAGTLATLLSWQFGAVLAVYTATTLAYSFFLKRVLLVDVLTLAGLFTLRVIAGAAVLTIPVSTWLLAFCVFFFLSLALLKRFVELQQKADSGGGKLAGRGYHNDDIETIGQAGLASAFAAVVVLALFIDSPQITQNYANPQAIWLVLPAVLYVAVRVWILARRREMHDDPVVFILTDWRSQIMIAAGAIVMLASQWMPVWA